MQPGNDHQLTNELTPCRLSGCPVKAAHEARAYKFDDSRRPNFIKMLQLKAAGGEGKEHEFEKLDRFFLIHKSIPRTRSMGDGKEVCVGHQLEGYLKAYARAS